jgi:hypothetical protein
VVRVACERVALMAEQRAGTKAEMVQERDIPLLCVGDLPPKSALASAWAPWTLEAPGVAAQAIEADAGSLLSPHEDDEVWFVLADGPS